MIDIPDVVRQKALTSGAGQWLTDLPDLVATIESRWEISVGAVYPDATEALVARATTLQGEPAVLKLIVPRGSYDAANEITVYQLAGGDGCARLLRHDVDRGALLLERLGPSLRDLGLPIERRHEILCDAARKLWRPVPESGLPTGAEKGASLVEYIVSTWEALDRPCSRRAVDHAIECAARRIAAHDAERAVLAHGDVHQWNALQAGDGFKLIDPDGLVVEPEYDLGIIMREDPVELAERDPRERALRLASLTGLNASAIWEWGVVERVATGLVCTSVDLQPAGRLMLGVSDRIARECPRLT